MDQPLVNSLIILRQIVQKDSTAEKCDRPLLLGKTHQYLTLEHLRACEIYFYHSFTETIISKPDWAFKEETYLDKMSATFTTNL